MNIARKTKHFRWSDLIRHSEIFKMCILKLLWLQRVTLVCQAANALFYCRINNITHSIMGTQGDSGASIRTATFKISKRLTRFTKLGPGGLKWMVCCNQIYLNNTACLLWVKHVGPMRRGHLEDSSTIQPFTLEYISAHQSHLLSLISKMTSIFDELQNDHKHDLWRATPSCHSFCNDVLLGVVNWRVVLGNQFKYLSNHIIMAIIM